MLLATLALLGLRVLSVCALSAENPASLELEKGASSPPAGAITIGSGGKYATISAALLDTPSSVYFTYAGTYKVCYRRYFFPSRPHCMTWGSY
jgi:hypothetical protein